MFAHIRRAKQNNPFRHPYFLFGPSFSQWFLSPHVFIFRFLPLTRSVTLSAITTMSYVLHTCSVVEGWLQVCKEGLDTIKTFLFGIIVLKKKFVNEMNTWYTLVFIWNAWNPKIHFWRFTNYEEMFTFRQDTKFLFVLGCTFTNLQIIYRG